MRWLIPLVVVLTPLFSQEEESPLQLSLNIEEGTWLQLSDGKTYEIAPEDRIYSSGWITPFSVKISESGDPIFPIKITNLTSGTSVRGAEIDPKALLKHPPPDEKDSGRQLQTKRRSDP